MDQLAFSRIGFWGSSYLESAEESYHRALAYLESEDAFTAYLYLFVAFNNVYSLLASFARVSEPEKMRKALDVLSDEEVEALYDFDFVQRIQELNERPPEQTMIGPDRGRVARGIINMEKYFRGYPLARCTAGITKIAPIGGTPQEKRRTLTELTTQLLFTVRNNQFHSVKGGQRLTDTYTLLMSCRLLAPIVESLMPKAWEQLRR